MRFNWTPPWEKYDSASDKLAAYIGFACALVVLSCIFCCCGGIFAL